MSGHQKIYHGNKLIAILFRNNLQANDIEFYTTDENSFQVGVHNRKKGIKLKPHLHIVKKPIVLHDSQEWILVKEGKIRVSMYTETGKITHRSILSTGDSILLISGGHGVDFLEDSQLFELKQGPYIDGVQSKKFLTPK